MINYKHTESDLKNTVLTKDILLVYLNNIYLKTKDARLADQNVRTRILKQMDDAREITGLSFTDLLRRLDFKPNDVTTEALEAFLAELRSIFWLRDFGFANINPLQARKIAQPDFTAKFKDKTCAIEVFCLTQAHEQQKSTMSGKVSVYTNFDPQFQGSKFGRDFVDKANSKKKQLGSITADVKILLCVVNSTPMVALNTKEEFDSYLELLYKQLNWCDGYYLGLLTGVHANGIASDTIFPKLI
jgi:hypothetical protein